MKTTFLLPHSFHLFGWLLFIPSAFLGIMSIFGLISFDFLNDTNVFSIYSSMFFEQDIVFGVNKNNIADEIIAVTAIIGALFIGFSKMKNEDEFILKTEWNHWF